MQEFISKSLEDTKEITSNLVVSLDSLIKYKEKATVIGLYGDLGSGKTTFMKYFAAALGIKETIQSPTFIIMKKYEIPVNNYKLHFTDFNNLIHIDAYRIEKSEELLKLGWEEIIKDPQNLICIEWPEHVNQIIPPHIMIRFDHLEDEKAHENQRKISIA